MCALAAPWAVGEHLHDFIMRHPALSKVAKSSDLGLDSSLGVGAKHLDDLHLEALADHAPGALDVDDVALDTGDPVLGVGYVRFLDVDLDDLALTHGECLRLHLGSAAYRQKLHIGDAEF